MYTYSGDQRYEHIRKHIKDHKEPEYIKYLDDELHQLASHPEDEQQTISLDRAQALLECGADPNSFRRYTHDGLVTEMNALHASVENNHDMLSHLLLRYFANPEQWATMYDEEVGTLWSWLPIHGLSMHEGVQAIAWLIQNGYPVETRCIDHISGEPGYTPMSYGFLYGRTDIVKKLAQYGAHISGDAFMHENLISLVHLYVYMHAGRLHQYVRACCDDPMQLADICCFAFGQHEDMQALHLLDGLYDTSDAHPAARVLKHILFLRMYRYSESLQAAIDKLSRDPEAVTTMLTLVARDMDRREVPLHLWRSILMGYQQYVTHHFEDVSGNMLIPPYRMIYNILFPQDRKAMIEQMKTLIRDGQATPSEVVAFIYTYPQLLSQKKGSEGSLHNFLAESPEYWSYMQAILRYRDT